MPAILIKFLVFAHYCLRVFVYFLCPSRNLRLGEALYGLKLRMFVFDREVHLSAASYLRSNVHKELKWAAATISCAGS